MGVLAREEESENEVRREDQDRINEFAKLNARKHEIRSERESIQVGTRKSYTRRERERAGCTDGGCIMLMMNHSPYLYVVCKNNLTSSSSSFFQEDFGRIG